MLCYLFIAFIRAKKKKSSVRQIKWAKTYKENLFLRRNSQGMGNNLNFIAFQGRSSTTTTTTTNFTWCPDFIQSAGTILLVQSKSSTIHEHLVANIAHPRSGQVFHIVFSPEEIFVAGRTAVRWYPFDRFFPHEFFTTTCPGALIIRRLFADCLLLSTSFYTFGSRHRREKMRSVDFRNGHE